MDNQTNEINHILISSEELDRITTGLAERISRDYEGKNLLLLGILKGSVIFMCDVMRKLSIPAEIEFMKVSSYGAGTVSSGRLQIHLDVMRKNLEKCDMFSSMSL